MAKSSINFQRASAHSFKHNSREEKRTAKTVFQEHTHLNECSISAASAKQMFDDLYQEAISKISGRTRRAKKENCLVEAVVNLNANHTLKDVEKLVKEIERETGFTAIQIAIHKDEGEERNGKLIRKNHHAHISFFTLDRETGRQMFRREHLTRSKLSKIQDITAETLKMQRGEKNSNHRRLNHKEYKEVAKTKELERATQKQLKEEIAQLRSELREANAKLETKLYTKDDYAKINYLNRELKEQLKKKELTLMELREKIAELRKALEEKEREESKEIKELAEARKALAEKKEQVKIFNKVFTEVAQEFNIETTSYGQMRDDIISKHKSTKQEVAELQKTIETLKEENSDLRAKYREIRDAFTEVAQVIGIKFTTVKQVVANIISKFKSTKEVKTVKETAKEPVSESESDDEIWERMKKFAYKQQNKYPKLR